MRLTAKVVSVIMVFLFSMCFSTVSADEKSKSAKLHELMELSGMIKIMEQARSKNKTQALQYKPQCCIRIMQTTALSRTRKKRAPYSERYAAIEKSLCAGTLYCNRGKQ